AHPEGRCRLWARVHPVALARPEGRYRLWARVHPVGLAHPEGRRRLWARVHPVALARPVGPCRLWARVHPVALARPEGRCHLSDLFLPAGLAVLVFLQSLSLLPALSVHRTRATPRFLLPVLHALHPVKPKTQFVPRAFYLRQRILHSAVRYPPASRSRS